MRGYLMVEGGGWCYGGIGSTGEWFDAGDGSTAGYGLIFLDFCDLKFFFNDFCDLKMDDNGFLNIEIKLIIIP